MRRLAPALYQRFLPLLRPYRGRLLLALGASIASRYCPPGSLGWRCSPRLAFAALAVAVVAVATRPWDDRVELGVHYRGDGAGGGSLGAPTGDHHAVAPPSRAIT